MSFEDGWAAIHLQMPPRVPRSEYSADTHWGLVKAATGVDVTGDSSLETQFRAQKAFRKAWNYDFIWSTMVGRGEFGAMRSNLSRTEYATGGIDRSSNLFQPFNDPEDILGLDPFQAWGKKNHKELVRRFEDHYRRNCLANPNTVNMTGIYITLISGLVDAFGWEMILLTAGIDPKRFGELANRYSTWIQQYFDALAAANVPVVMIHDDMVWTSGAIFAPDWYRKYIFPNLKKQLEPLIASGKRVLFTSDGNLTEFIDDIAACGVHGFVVEPATDMKYIAEKYGKTHIFVGNADTRVLLNGSHEQIRAEVARCMAIGKNCPGYFMAVGNHIPPNTPVANALYYNQAYNELSKR